MRQQAAREVAFVMLALAMPVHAQTCPADLTMDRVVDGSDLGALLGAWGACPGCAADLNADAVVNADDLGALLGAWGPCLPTVPAWATLIEPWPSIAAVPDNRIRAELRATGLAWRVLHAASGIEMLLVPPGLFDMGCSVGSVNIDCMPIEEPVHTVRLTSPFYMARHEVTQARWQAIMGSNPSLFQGPAYPDAALRPVERVSWDGVQAFLAATGLRLPTEAEWEHACRAGTTTAFHNGTNIDSTLRFLAWYWGNAGGMTRPVGQKQGNGFGLHDMLGNAWEWVADWYGVYGVEFQVDPQGPKSGEFRVIRGGGWGFDYEYVRNSGRMFMEPSAWNAGVGFRVAMSP
jgi:formylglycine-generating enzyme required for sulfatase activity